MIFKIENDVISEETVGNSNLIVSFLNNFSCINLVSVSKTRENKK